MNIRPRRNRKNAAIRDMVQEAHLGVEHLIFPVFLKDGTGVKEEISSLPNIYRWSVDILHKEIEECVELGIRVFDIFPCVEEHLKDKTATLSYNPDNFYLKAIQKIKETFPDVVLMSDVALDPYSSDGHDGLVQHHMTLCRRCHTRLSAVSIVLSRLPVPCRSKSSCKSSSSLRGR